MAREHAVARERIRIARDILTIWRGVTQMAPSLTNWVRGDRPPQSARPMDQFSAPPRWQSLNEIVWAVNPKNDTLDSVLT
jgi:hypothetical protein